MRTLFLFICLLSPGFLTAQQTPMATLRVTVMNKQRVALPKDKITFIAQKDGARFSGISNERGQFLIKLPSGDDYAIMVEMIGEEEEYNTFSIPSPPPGAVFKTVDLEVLYELPESIVLEDVHFASGSASLDSSSHESLDRLADYLLRKTKIRIRVEGHTDSDGDASKNLSLSKQRAKAVREYLIAKGVPSARMESEGFGELKPIADNSTEEGKQQNRRTEIHIL